MKEMSKMDHPWTNQELRDVVRWLIKGSPGVKRRRELMKVTGASYNEMSRALAGSDLRAAQQDGWNHGVWWVHVDDWKGRR